MVHHHLWFLKPRGFPGIRLWGLSQFHKQLGENLSTDLTLRINTVSTDVLIQKAQSVFVLKAVLNAPNTVAL